MKNKIYIKPKVDVYTFRLEESVAAASQAPINVGDNANPFVPQMDEFVEDASFSGNNYKEI